MRVCVTAGRETSPLDLQLAGELAPSLALPWVVRLRYGMVLGQIGTILFVILVLRVRLPLAWLAIPIAAVTLSNVFLRLRLSRAIAHSQQWLGLLFCLDTVCLTALLGLSGGPMNPFSLLYLVHITLSAVILHRAWAWVLGGLSTVCFGLLFWVYKPLPWEAEHVHQAFSLHLVGMWVAFAVAALMITLVIAKIAEVLRQREQDVLSLQNQVARSHRLTSLVTLAGGAAHELSTPLATIAVASKELLHYATQVRNDSRVAEDAQLIRSEVDRCLRILQQMSARGAEPSGEAPAPIGIREILRRVKERFTANQQRILNIDVAEDGADAVLPCRATVEALAALVQNALDANVEDRSIALRAAARPAGVRFEVQDRGRGMSPEILDRIAEPFFTTKEPGSGMGLGVFLVRVFAEHLGGHLIFDSVPSIGTTAILELPVAASRLPYAAVPG